MKANTIRNPYAKRPRPAALDFPKNVTEDHASRKTVAAPPVSALHHTKAPSQYPNNNSCISSPNHRNSENNGMSPTYTPKNEDHNASTKNENDSRKNETASALVIAASDKAGMEGIDRKRIDAIILRESGNSLFMQQQRRRDQQVNERIASLKQKLAQALPGWEKEIHRQLNTEIPSILANRPTRSTAVVVDMDAFYMACELLSRPDLKERPACVGRGMILTSNYKARAYGVRSAMAGWIGDKLVQELSNGKEKLIHVPSNFPLYKEKSRVVREVLAQYDPNLKAYSLDEAYMDLGPYLALKLSKGWSHEEISKAISSSSPDGEKATNLGWTDSQAILASYSPSLCLETASQVLESMRQAVCDATGGLTCSAGLAPNTLLAKIASDRNKPNGQCLVGPDHEMVHS